LDLLKLWIKEIDIKIMKMIRNAITNQKKKRLVCGDIVILI